MKKSINFFPVLSLEDIPVFHPGKKGIYYGALWIVFILIPPVVHSQVSIGVYGGIQFTKFSGTIPGDHSYTNKTGYEIGIITSINLFEDVYLNLRPGINQSGTSVSGNESFDPLSDSTLFFAVTTKSVQLPSLIEVRVSNGFYALGGINASYFMSAEADVGGVGSDVLHYFTPLQFQGVFGFGLGFNKTRISADFELAYMQGLNTLTQQKYVDDGSIRRIRSQGFRATITIDIDLSNKEQDDN